MVFGNNDLPGVMLASAARVFAGLLIAVPATFADHIPGHQCSGCASHKEEWPTINGKFKKATGGRSATHAHGAPAATRRSAASTALRNSIAIVVGPTPPTRGVM